jgi:hypothetical protein
MEAQMDQMMKEVANLKVATVHTGENGAEVEQLTLALLKTIHDSDDVVNTYTTMCACVSVIATMASLYPTKMLQDMRGCMFDAMATAFDSIKRKRGTN